MSNANQIQKPQLKLTDGDSNAFVILARAQKAARKSGLISGAQWAEIQKEAISGDYNHLLAIICEHFDVS